MTYRINQEGMARFLIVITTIYLFNAGVALALKSRFEILTSGNTSNCACPGELLTFVCTTVGPGSTIWRGTAFNCTGQTNEIILLHSRFSLGTSASCISNSGAITAQSLGVERDCYTSQLNITTNVQFKNKTIQCVYSSDEATIIGQSSLNIVSDSNPYPPPNDVSLIEIGQGLVTFNWSPSCDSIDYVITSDCGDCPFSTNSTTVTCSGLQLPTQSDGVVCSFNVSSRVCGILGNQNSSVLAVPDVPRVLSIIPQYANESQVLKNLTININMNNTGVMNNVVDISGPVTRYIAAYTALTALVNTSTPAESVSCKDDVCTFNVAVPSTVCSSSTDIDVTISAANRIGQGPSAETVTIGCTNTFVHVNFNSITSVLSCLFLNERDTSMKSCSIEYGLRNQELSQRSSTVENLNVVSLDLGDLEDGTYYYVVTASSNTTAISIEGNFTIKDAQGKETNLALILGTVLGIPAAIMLIVLSVILLMVIVFKCKRHRSDSEYEPQPTNAYDHELSDVSLKKQLKLEKITDREFKIFKVEQDCALREFIEKKEPKIESWRGRVYYELTDEEEYITDDKELILQKIVKKEATPDGKKQDSGEKKEATPDSKKQIPEPVEGDTVEYPEKKGATRDGKEQITVLVEGVQDLEDVASDTWFFEQQNTVTVEHTEKEEATPDDKKQVPVLVEGVATTSKRCTDPYNTGYFELQDTVEHTVKKEATSDDSRKQNDTGKLYTIGVDSNMLRGMGFKGQGIKRSKFGDNYRTFVQSKGSGKRHLASGSYVLYDDPQPSSDSTDDHEQLEQMQNLADLPLWPVPSEYFETTQVTDEAGTTLENFHKKYGLRNNKFNTFLEYNQMGQKLKEADIKDVLLMNKVTGELFTGPFARHFMKFERGTNIDKSHKWRVLVLSKFKEGLSLRKNTWVAYEDPRYYTGIFHVMKVDRDNERMSKFERGNDSFEPGSIFYKFTEKENLPCCRKIIRMEKTKLKQSSKDGEKEDATIEIFYNLPGAPGMEISPPELKDFRDFIHCPSQGSRCLKKGTVLLYRSKHPAQSKSIIYCADPERNDSAKEGKEETPSKIGGGLNLAGEMHGHGKIKSSK